MLKASDLRDLLATEQPPELGPGPRAGVRAEGELNRELDGRLRGSGLAPEKQQLIRALVLLWHDHLEPAHRLAQAVAGPDGAFVHGIMHRREPDYGNAAYWFRQVGKHRAYVELAKRVARLLDEAGSGHEALRKRLLSHGEWDGFGFIDACEEAAGAAAGTGKSGGAGESDILRRIQRIEMETLLEYLCMKAD